MALEQEIAYFEENRSRWREIYLGKFVVVKGRELKGTHDTAEQAIANGARLFGSESFLVRQITDEERPVFIPALVLGLLSPPSDAHPA